MSEYTIVLTSCGRFDLLKQTLTSLFNSLDEPPSRTIVIEDTGNVEVESVVSGMQYPVEVVLNNPQLGQMRAIDKAYALVDTPYIFHCEDDWEFSRYGFVKESIALLEACPDASMICLRPRHELNPRIRDMPEMVVRGIRCFSQDPTRHPEYFSHSFNPGMRRLADYRKLGPYAEKGREEDISYLFKKNGFRIYNLAEPAVCHIGGDRHVDDPTQPKRAKSFLPKLRRSIMKRIKRIRRKIKDI